MTDVLISIKPRFAEAIIQGEKTHELRRKFPSSLAGATVYVYASSPVCAVIGSFRIASIERRPRWLLARTRRLATTLTSEEINSYLEGLDHGVLIEATERRRFARAVPLADLRQFGVEPPQSYRFISGVVRDQLEQASGRILRPTRWILAGKLPAGQTGDRAREPERMAAAV